MNDTKIYAGIGCSLRIIACKDGKEVFVNEDELQWHEFDDGLERVLTLEEISEQLISLGFERPFYVWQEIEHGQTRGFA